MHSLPPCLTVWQPLASGIIAGIKTIENRSIAPTALIGNRLLIHAGLKIDESAIEGYPQLKDVAYEMRRGAIIGSVCVIAFVTESSDPFFRGPIGWVLQDPRPFEIAIPARGQQGLWRVPAEIGDRVHRQLISSLL